MTTLFIHIGAPKTGTTAIQDFLLRNREHLRRHGVLYPMAGLFKSAHHTIGAAVFPGRSHRLVGVSRDEALRSSVANVRSEIEQSKPHTVILSSEYLWGRLSREDVRSLLEPFSDCTIKIIAYLRRQDLLAQSLYVQAVKGGLADAFPVWLERVADGERAGFDFHRVLSCWTTSGIPAEIVVRVYEKAQLKQDICTDFLGTVCPQGIAVPQVSAHVANPGPDQATVELLRLVSRGISDPEIGTRVRKQILANSPARPLFAPLNYLTPPEAAAFVARFAESNAKVARDFLGRANGSLFEEPSPVAAGTHPAGPSTDAILERLTRLLPILLGDTTSKKPMEQSSAKATARRRKSDPSSAPMRLDIEAL